MALPSQGIQLFTPGKDFSYNEKDWAAEVGMLPWDSHVVFTKESLIRFLKTLEIEVGPSMSEVRKLPKFAQFGTLKPHDAEPLSSQAAETPVSKPSAPKDVQSSLPTPPRSAPSSAAKAEETAPETASASNTFRPTRKVRELPGGGSAQIASLFGGGGEDEEPIEDWRRKPSHPRQSVDNATPLREKVARDEETKAKREAEDEQKNAVVMPDGSTFVPSRKVREPVGGFSSMAALLSGDS